MPQKDAETILIVGLGLIGGSIAKGLKIANPKLRILAVDHDRGQVEQAAEEGAVVEISGSARDLAAEADLIVVCVPTLSVAAVLEEISGSLQGHTVVTDVASVKTIVVEQAKSILGNAGSRFVPGHPIAGSEKSGYLAAIPDLFRGRKVILTPDLETDTAALMMVQGMWRLLGAHIVGMPVDQHDEVLAATSHLPHLLAYALVDVLANDKQSEDIFRYAAGGFADFSRLASSDPDMWADIFVANAATTINALNKFVVRLKEIKVLLESTERNALRQSFALSKTVRDRFVSEQLGGREVSMDQAQKQVNFLAFPGGSVSGELRVPGDKSISHRAVILGALAEGVTKVTGFLESEDALKTVEAFREMGVTIVGPDDGKLTIYGVGIAGLRQPRKPLYMGNSGTAMRLLAGLLAAQKFDSELSGDSSLTVRPMLRIAEPLRLMGAHIQTSSGGTPPLKIQGADLTGVEYKLPMASAQVKSCLLLAGIFAKGKTQVQEPVVCRDHTERMLQGFGYAVEVDKDQRQITIQGGGTLTATSIDVPADISSAAFFLVAAAISNNSSLTLKHVGVNETRTGIIELLKLMGANIELLNHDVVGGEPVADIFIRHSILKGMDIPKHLIPLAIDEFPAMFIAAACADGVTRLRGAEELRVKESDRLQAMADGLSVLGITHELFEDGIDITGGKISGGEVDSHGDHRIAMAFSIAALRSDAPIRILNCANVATSFPNFVSLANTAGLNIEQQFIEKMSAS